MVFGRIICSLIGYVSFGFVGALIGFFVGSLFDKGLGGVFQALSPEEMERRQEVFFSSVFLLMGKLAKSDGRVCEQEIAHTEQFMTHLNLSAEHRVKAIELFKEGAEADVASVMAEFNQSCGLSPQMKQLLLVYLAGVCLADGELAAEEESLLHEISSSLGFPRAFLDQLLSMLRGQDHFSQEGRQQGTSSVSDLQAAYAALGVEESVSDAELKKAYRKLMSQFHPDKLMGEGVPDDMIKVATERAQEIQVAYSLITKQRKNIK